MKTMLKLSVLSLMISVTLSAEPTATEGSHAASGTPAAASSSSPTAEASKAEADELVAKINACLEERSKITAESGLAGLGR